MIEMNRAKVDLFATPNCSENKVLKNNNYNILENVDEIINSISRCWNGFFKLNRNVWVIYKVKDINSFELLIKL